MASDFHIRLEKVLKLADNLGRNRRRLITSSNADIGFGAKDVSLEIDITIRRLRGAGQMADLVADREPLCRRKGEKVAVMFSYNGATWLSAVIASIYMAGNDVMVKFSSKCARISATNENLYRPIFGDEISFDSRSGRDFINWSIDSPDVPAIVLFGSDATAWPYRQRISRSGKTFIFEGPGKDPFIVFGDADLKQACRDLAQSKYWYSGQTCTAPERIYVQRKVYREFMDMFIESSRKVVVGRGSDPRTDVAPLGSRVVLKHIEEQLSDAVRKGGRIVLGGRTEGLLVFPTIIAGANHDMVGMKEETFGPVTFFMPFEDMEEATHLAADNRYGLRASVWGGAEAVRLAERLRGEGYLHQVPRRLYGKFGTVSLNQSRQDSWKGAFITKAIGGYGDSGWVWKKEKRRHLLFQGPKLPSLETTL